MKKLILLVLLLRFSLYAESYKATPDKVAHFIATFAISEAIETHYHSRTEYAPYFAFASTMLIGYSKEQYDDKFSEADLAYDVAGALCGTLLGAYINPKFIVIPTKDGVAMMYKKEF